MSNASNENQSSSGLPQTELGNLAAWLYLAREGLLTIETLADSAKYGDQPETYTRWAKNVVDALDLATLHVMPYPESIKDAVFIIVAGMKRLLQDVAKGTGGEWDNGVEGLTVSFYKGRFQDAGDRYGDAILDMVNRIEGHDLRHGKPQSPLDARGTFEIGELAEMARAYMADSATKAPSHSGADWTVTRIAEFVGVDTKTIQRAMSAADPVVPPGKKGLPRSLNAHEIGRTARARARVRGWSNADSYADERTKWTKLLQMIGDPGIEVTLPPPKAGRRAG
ncbi:hypothetical protein ACERK3_09680 [Phycisphaerales bacterium AB-hyl4]|uniref:Uncharacterized protein n=1 Tax=Natronomicrosphaera hydrolytica TaxID=3242702 RepID=A0ABV4U4N3_9BACT